MNLWSFSDFAIRSVVQEDVKTIQAAAVDHLAAVVRQGQAEGTFRPVNPDQVAELVFGATRQMAQQRLGSPSPWPVNAMTRQVLDFLLHGLEQP